MTIDTNRTQEIKSPPIQTPRKRRKPWLALFIIILIASLGTVAFLGWTHVYTTYLETNSPQIVPVEIPRGIGLSSVSVKVNLIDAGSGLDEVVVRTRQRGAPKEILRRSLEGKLSAKLTIDFPGDKSDLEEGHVDLEIKAFDRSFWNNSSTKVIPLNVDFRKPKLETISVQHNAREGGSQLVVYRATDEQIALSGVKVNNQNFPGFPARNIDKDLDDTSLAVAVYAIDIREPGGAERSVKLFAEDQVGNSSAIEFNNRIQRRTLRKVNVKVNEDFLRQVVAPLADQNIGKIARAAKNGNSDYKTNPGSPERLLEQFSIVNGPLRALNDKDISEQLKGPRFEKLWDGVFLRPQGSILQNFGDLVSFEYDGNEIGTALQTGYEFTLPRTNADVYAANSGIVCFAENIGIFGRVLGIDHGLGVFSIYGRLDQAFVRKGEKVTRGQKIARAGGSGFSRTNQLYFEMRVHGIPVAPEEWWEDQWFFDHITTKMNDVRQILGFPIIRTLDR